MMSTRQEDEISKDGKGEEKLSRKEFLSRTGKIIALGTLTSFSMIGLRRGQAYADHEDCGNSSFRCQPNQGIEQDPCSGNFWGYVACIYLTSYTKEP